MGLAEADSRIIATKYPNGLDLLTYPIDNLRLYPQDPIKFARTSACLAVTKTVVLPRKTCIHATYLI